MTWREGAGDVLSALLQTGHYSTVRPVNSVGLPDLLQALHRRGKTSVLCGWQDLQRESGRQSGRHLPHGPVGPDSWWELTSTRALLTESGTPLRKEERVWWELNSTIPFCSLQGLTGLLAKISYNETINC